jgi:hypothetical protein
VRKKIIIHILLPLLAGVFVYIIFREPVTALHKFLHIKKALFPLSNEPGNQFLLFHFTDMCWAYALTSSLILFTRFTRLLCAAIGIAALSVFELKQSGWHLQGFDWLDCGLMILAVLLATLIVKK